jgi:bacterioferritin
MARATNNDAVMECLHQIFRSETAGIVRYLHYSFMIMGHNRIPIQAWFRAQASENMTHAITIGEKITSLGGHPPVMAAGMEESNVHTVDQILNESLKHEESGLALYKQLAELAQGDIALEELAREFVRTETEHIDEVRKMLRKPQ